MCDVLHYLVDNIYRFGSNLLRHIVGIPMGTIAPIVADLCLFSMRAISCSIFLTITKLMLFNSTSRYLDDLLDIETLSFEQMVDQRLSVSHGPLSLYHHTVLT